MFFLSFYKTTRPKFFPLRARLTILFPGSSGWLGIKISSTIIHFVFPYFGLCLGVLYQTTCRYLLNKGGLVATFTPYGFKLFTINIATRPRRWCSCLVSRLENLSSASSAMSQWYVHFLHPSTSLSPATSTRPAFLPL